MRARLIITLLALATVLAAPAAHATVRREPVRVRLAGPPVAATAGVALEQTLVLESKTGQHLTGLRLSGDGWSVRAFGAPATLHLVPGERQRIPFVAIPQHPDAPLRLTYEAGGHTFSRNLDLSRAAIRRATTSGVMRVEATRDGKPLPAGFFRPRPDSVRARARLDTPENVARRTAEGAWSSAQPVRPAAEPPAGPGIASLTTVKGTVMFERPDGTVQAAEGVRVSLYATTWLVDVFWYGTFTDAQGRFSFTYDERKRWMILVFELDGEHAKVQSTDAFEVDYSWESGEFCPGDGTYIVNCWPEDEDLFPAIHIHNQLTRAWRWLDARGRGVERIDVQWPEGGSGSGWYDTGWEEIHLTHAEEWSEALITQLYGHHWVNNHSADLSPDYCNAVCDDGGCGHCLWCRETDEIAWSEGFPDWFSDVVVRGVAEDSGVEPYSAWSFEDLRTCSEDGAWHDPTRTEGFFAALLRDIEDAGQDDNDPSDAWRDRLSRGADPIFAIAATHDPVRPSEFLAHWKDDYPADRQDLWETAKDIGYELDVDPPQAVTNLASPTHPVQTAVTDATPTFSWTRAEDDCSGPAGYSLSVSSPNPVQPDAVQDIGDVTRFTGGVLSAGAYYFNIRTRDRAGRWQTGYAAYGPIIVENPEPANLAAEMRLGWDGVIVPRPTSDATKSSCPNPTSLTGNSSSTYWNTSGGNTGDLATSRSCYTRLYVDGVHRASASQGVVAAGASFYSINQGPVNIQGGRHTFESFLDGSEVIAEGSETDNQWAEQWIWSPRILTTGVTVTRGAPPDRTGGWDAVGPGPTLYYNCDGLRMNIPGFWNAVWLHATADSVDYDCRLHSPSAGVQSGFGSSLGWSSRDAGCLDAVLVNGNRTLTTSWDVGVLNLAGAASNYAARHVVSQSLEFGDSVAITIPAGEMMVLRDFIPAPGDLGPVRVTVRSDSTGERIHVLWYDDLFETGDLLDANAEAVTDEHGLAVLDFTLEFDAPNGLVLYRDPQDGAAAALTFVLEIETRPPDFEPYAAAGWYAPFVPRPADDGAPGLVPAPVTLAGNAASTYFNYAVRNASPASAGAGMGTRAYVDGVAGWLISWGGFTANGSRTYNSPAARTVRGGRHLVSVRHDADDLIEELDETDNVHGEQWVWSPLALALDTPVTRSAPPSPTGGFEDLTAPFPLRYNCDGLRTPTFAPAGLHGWWGAVAIMPSLGSDVDVRLHDASDDVRNSFGLGLKRSSWGMDLSDFVVIHLRATPSRSFDAGVLLDQGAGDYTAEAVASVYRGAEPSGAYGPYTLGAGHLLQLHEFVLGVGAWRVTLENAAGAVDWGFSVHPDTAAFFAKSEVMPGGAVWESGPGAGEEMIVTILESGPYCIAVWKNKADDRPKEGSYVLRFSHTTTDAPPEGPPPARVHLAMTGANPFKQAARLAFELPAAAAVRLEVFDVRGARVRELLAEARAAGRHIAAWDGRDDHGHDAGGGMYFVRLQAGAAHRTLRLVKLE
jgi:hypothetical protein